VLYVTTREKYDAYTAQRTLASDCDSRGGLYLPFRMPVFSGDEISALGEASFGQCVADILNRFFSARLTAWDVEFAVGRHPVKISTAGHRILAAELWRNLEGSYPKMETRLASKVCNCDDRDVQLTSWLRIAIRIAVVFGLYAQLLRSGAVTKEQSFDVAVPAGDFSLPMALWYARGMGLPIANIICSCTENDGAWNLIRLGEVRANCAVPELERLIYGTLGISEVERCNEVLEKGGVFRLLPETLETLKQGVFTSVVSDERTESMISAVYRSSSCILDPDSACSYGGLMDYRAKSGENRVAVLLMDDNPADRAEVVAGALRISADDLKKRLDNA